MFNETKLMLYDPSICTLNLGDSIIAESAFKVIDDLFPTAYKINVSTHVPISFRYLYYLRNVNYRFVCGTNLLKSKMLFGFRQWDINIMKAPFMRNQILLGCGWCQYGNSIDSYSKALYRVILSKDYIHSVRDNYTKRKLESIGINNVVNTGCPTMWSFNDEFCAQIPSIKSKNVVTTLTDYNRSDYDTLMLDHLFSNYDNVYLWLQGYSDYEYLNSLSFNKQLKIVPPSLQEYDTLLESLDIDYIGTRLHAGIRALQKKKRSIIIGVDNRAIEKKKDFNLPVITRNDIDTLPDIINSSFQTKIDINEDAINTFLEQFNV